jgi:alpha-amylase
VNGHFGSAVDLKALSNALHERGMYLMVDVAINALASTQNDLSDSALASAEGGNLLFKHRDNYHQECNIDWGNGTSEEVWYVDQSHIQGQR